MNWIFQLFHCSDFSPVTIRGYKPALSDYFVPTIVDIENSEMKALTRLISKFYNENPASVKRVFLLDLLCCYSGFEETTI